MRRMLLVHLFVLTFLLAGCTAPQDLEPAAAPGSGSDDGLTVERPTTAPTPTLGPSPTAPPSPTKVGEPVFATPTPTPVAMTPTSDDAPVPTPTPVPPFPGIVFRTEEGLWLSSTNWQPQQIAARPDLTLAPELSRALYVEGGDVWIMDLATGAAHNITEGSGREHISAQWWPARPDTIVLMSWGENDTGPNSGKLTLVNADGSDYRVAHPEGDVSYAEPAPSPDGVTIAYDEAGIPMLYTIDGGAEPFAPNSFSGFPAEVTFPHGGSPAWSPDGAELAWVLAANGGGYGTSSGWDVVVGVFDLTTGEARLLHPFQPVGRGGWFAAPRWSPDGQWLAFHVEATSADERGLWVIAADGSSEQQLTRADLGTALGTARWNPPGPQPWTNPAHLLYSTYTTGDGIDYYVAQAGNWGTAVVQLPEGAMLTDWVTIE